MKNYRKSALALAIAAATVSPIALAQTYLPTPDMPCEGGSNCTGNWVFYGANHSAFVTGQAFMTSGMNGQAVDVPQFTNLQNGTWGLRNYGESFEYRYVDGYDDYGYPMYNYQTAYAGGVNLNAGQTVNMGSVLAATGGGRITNLADGVAAMDAVNKRQLDAAMANAGGNDPLAVKYTNNNRNQVSVGGRMTNVANGTASGDAVNLGQLNGVQTIANNARTRADLGVSNAATAQTTANTARNDVAALDSVAVKYTSTGRTAVSLGGTTAVRVQNVANGTASGDAVNLGQLNGVQTIANNARTRADLGVTNAATAQQRADLGVTNAATAQARADLGVTNAATAQTTANNARTRADLGVTNAATAQQRADLGVTNAATAQTTANTARNDVAALDSVAVKYTSTGRTAVSLGGTTAVRVQNVANGTASGDAVNLGQLNGVETIANNARTRADLGVTNAATAQARADLGVTNAATAQTTANNARTRADLGVANAATAQQRADLGVTNAATAQARADLGVTNAATAQTTANNARTRADLGVANAATAQQRADLGVTNAATAQASANEISGYVTASGSESGDDASATVEGFEAVALGRESTAGGMHVAVGYGARSSGEDLTAGVAIGHRATAYDSAIAIGAQSEALHRGIAIGTGTHARELSVALGENASANYDAVAIGPNTYAAPNSVAIGKGSQANQEMVVSIGHSEGYRRIVNMADGEADSDGATVGQLRSLEGNVGELGGLAVQYTDTTHAEILLGGEGGTRIRNVADGVEAADAVNRGQLDVVSNDLAALDERAVQLIDGVIDGRGGRVVNVADGIDDGDAANMGQLRNLAGDVGELGGLAVQYTDTTHAEILLGGEGGTRIRNVADGTDEADAVNLRQLTGVSDQLDQLGGLAVQYTDTTHGEILLGGADGTRIRNVADGVEASDAVNRGQLDGVSDQLDQLGGLAVQYTDTTHGEILLGGADGTRIRNVADGTDEADAVNLRQLTGVSDQLDQLGGLAVQYTDTTHAEILLGGEDGTRIRNVADGTDEADAVNLRQLTGVSDQLDQLGGLAVQYTDTTHAEILLGGEDGTRIRNVADGVEAADAVNRGQLDGVSAELAALDERAVQLVDGIIDGRGGRIINVADGIDDGDAANMGQLRSLEGDVGELSGLAVQYTDTTHGEILLGGADGTRIRNVADGTDEADAVNLRQLTGVSDQLDQLGGLAVQYTDTTHGEILLGGADGTRIRNVADGVEASDAVNRGQLDGVSAELAALDERAVQLVDGIIDGRGGRVVNVADGIDDGDAANMGQLRSLEGDVGELSGLAVQYTDTTHQRIELAHAGTRISNVAGGFEAGDAVNFGQLESVSAVLGGGSSWNGSSFNAPTYTIAGSGYGDVGSAFAAVDSQLGWLSGRVERIENGVVWYDAPPAGGTSDAPETPANTGKGSVTLDGEGGTRISNVADGVEAGDAANVRQVQAAQAAAREYTDTRTTETKSYTDERMRESVRESNAYTDRAIANQVVPAIEGLRDDMNIRFGAMGERINRQAAISAATSQMAAQAANARSPAGRIAAGVGFSGGEKALSIGLGRPIGDRGTVSAGFTFSGNESSAGVGIGFDL